MTQNNTEQTPRLTVSSPVSRSFKIPLLLVAILAVNALVTIGYTSFYIQKKIKPNELATQQFQQQLTRIQTMFQLTQKEFITSTEARLNHFDSTLNQELKTLHSKTSDWKLLKARYYLELAAINNIWTTDTQTTLGLLKEADALLSQIPGEGTTNVRQALADEETAILAMPKLDITGILTTLHALQNEVDNLNQFQVSQSENKTPSVIQKPISSMTWREHLHQTMQTLRSLVIIRHQDDPISTYMTPADIRIQREAIRLNLQEAQWAVLNRQASIYTLMLTQASSAVNRVFDPNDDKNIAFLKQINQLKSVNLSQDKPSLETALTRLNQLIQTSSNETSGEQP